MLWPPGIISWITVTLTTVAWAAQTNWHLEKRCCSDNHIPEKGQNCSDGFRMDIGCVSDSIFVILHEPVELKLIEGSYILNLTNHQVEHIFRPDEFCMGKSSEENKTLVAVICISALFDIESPSTDRNVYLKFYSYFLLVSVIFLAATFLVYCLIPSLRDLQGRCLMCFVGCLAIGYLSLATLQQNFFDYNVSNTVCTAFGFWTYFWLLCAFFWLSLIAFNIWYQSRFVATSKDGTLWIIYLLFGFGIPIMFQIGALISHHIPSSYLFKPNIGNGVCWFQGVTETWVYFSGPMAILLFSNLMFFMMTTRILWIHYKEARPQTRIRTLRFKMVLYLKLFLTMGLTWIFELVSFTFQIDWYVSDILNSLQGPIIFILMVLTRKRVIRTLSNVNCCLSICYLCTRPWARQDEDDDDDNETEALEDIQLS